MPQAVRAHMIAHRYSVAKENIKDMFTYHALVLVEWDHGKYTTIFELAWLNGLGGYGGKSNWIDDRVSAHTFDFPLFVQNSASNNHCVSQLITGPCETETTRCIAALFKVAVA